ncbi:MAG: hypothetical protein GX882_05860 [Methanomicrobiales archaeon]|nr:hypothetical protein [Methanomicrobiales archaeon]
MDANIKRYGLYLIRWQLSTPILAGVLYLLAGLGALTATIIANLIGGLIFFWVDRFIFTSQQDTGCMDHSTIAEDCDRADGPERPGTKPEEIRRRGVRH